MTQFSTPQRTPQMDNPIHHLIENVLGVGKNPKNISEYLKQGMDSVKATGRQDIIEGLLVEKTFTKKGKTLVQSEPILPHRQFLSRVDPNGVAANMVGMRRVSLHDPAGGWTSEAGTLLSSLFSRNSQAERLIVNSLTNKLRTGTGAPMELLFHEKQSALFYGAPDMGYAPIPIQVNSVIHRGFKRYSAGSNIYDEMMGDLSTSVTNRADANDMFEVFKNKKGISKRYLRPAPNRKGLDTWFTEVGAGLSRIHHLDKNSSLSKAIKSRDLASSIVNMVTRSGWVPDKLNPANLPMQTLFAQAKRELDSFPRKLLSALDEIDPEMKEYYPYIKAEYLLGGQKGIVLPNVNNILRLFGNAELTDGAKAKGLHQLFKRGLLSKEHISRLGTNALPMWLTKGRRQLAKELGKPELEFHGMPLRIGVAEFHQEEMLGTRLVFQDSGLLLTPKGAKELSHTVYKGKMEFDVTHPGQAKTVEQLFGINLSTEFKQTPGNFFSFSQSEFEAAVYSDEKEWSALVKSDSVTKQQKQMRRLLRTKKGRIHKYAGTFEALNRSKLTQAQVRGTKVILDFASGPEGLPGALELEIGTRRFSATTNPALKDIGGLHALMSAEDFLKTADSDVLLTSTFRNYRRMEGRKGMRPVAKKIRSALLSTGISEEDITYLTNSKTGRVKGKVFTIGDRDVRSSIEKIRSILHGWAVGGDADLKSFAQGVMGGEEVASNVAINGAQINSIRAFSMMGGLRTDFMGDIDPMRGTRLTMGKVSMLASGARMFGYDDIDQHPIFGLLKDRLARTSYYLDPLTLIMKLKKSSGLYKAFTAIAGIGMSAPDEAAVISITKDGLRFGDRKLAELPHRLKFGHREGGVMFGDLAGTILDRSSAMPDLAFIDLGKVMDIHIGGVKRPIRYVPVMKQYLRTNKGVGGRVVVNKTHAASSLIRLVNNVQAGGNVDASRKDVESYVNTFVASVPRPKVGKRGLLEDVETINISGGFRARLTPQKGSLINRGNTLNTDNLFDIHMSKGDFEDFLMRRKTKDPALIAKLREDMSRQGYIDTLFSVDPTQRSGHQLYARLKIGPGDTKTRSGQWGVSLHHLIFRMLERDVDRDVGNITPLSAIGNLDSDKLAKLSKLRRDQIRKIEPFALMHHAELLEAANAPLAKRIEDFMGGVRGKVTDAFESMGAFISQKSQAHYGYTITRAVDRWMDGIVLGSQDDIAGMGIDVAARPLVDYMRSAIGNADLPVIKELSQHLFQGGVKKAEEAPLLKLAEGLINLRETAVSKKMAGTDVERQGYQLFHDYLTSPSQKGSSRLFFATRDLLEKLPGETSASIDKMLADLTRGLKNNSAEAISRTIKLRDAAIEQASILLGRAFGLGFAVQKSIKNRPQNLLQTAQDVTSSESNLMGKVVTNVLGSKDIDPGVSLAEDVNEADAALEALKKEVTTGSKSGFKKALESIGGNKTAIKLGALAGAGVVAAAGLAASFSGPPMPMPMDTRRPDDYGPNLTTLPRVSMPQNISAGRKSGMQGFKDYNSIIQPNRFPSTTNVHFLDDSGGRGDLMAERQLQHQLMSEF